MILDLLKKRCSVRYFMDKDIPQETIDLILEAGRLSPSGGNEQPWKFGVITDKELIVEISLIAYKQYWIKSAPLLIVLCADIVEDKRGARQIQKSRFPKWNSRIEEMEKELYSCLNMEEHQTKIPGTHMILEALEHGIGSTWISYFRVDKLSELLGLPKNLIPSEIIAFGYPAGDMSVKPKKNIEDIVFYNKYIT